MTRHFYFVVSIAFMSLFAGCSNQPSLQQESSQQAAKSFDSTDSQTPPTSVAQDPTASDTAETPLREDAETTIPSEPSDASFTVAHATNVFDLTKLDFPPSAKRREQSRTMLSFAKEMSDNEVTSYFQQAFDELECENVKVEHTIRLFKGYRRASTNKTASIHVTYSGASGDANQTHIGYGLFSVDLKEFDPPPLLDNATDVYREKERIRYSVPLTREKAIERHQEKLVEAGWEPDHEMISVSIGVEGSKQGVHVAGGASLEAGSPSYVSISVRGTLLPSDLPRYKAEGTPAHLAEDGKYLAADNRKVVSKFVDTEMKRLGFQPYDAIQPYGGDDVTELFYFRGGTGVQVLLKDRGNEKTEVLHGVFLFPFDVPMPPKTTKIAMSPYSGHFYIETTDNVKKMTNLFRERLTEFGWKYDDGRSRLDPPKPRFVFVSDQPRKTWWLEVWEKKDVTAIELRRR